MNVGFVTFAGGDLFWKLSAFRISRQAANAGVFSKIGNYSPDDLESIASPQDRTFIEANRRGFGYWLWKPIIILDFLEKNPEIEAVLYADAGCDLNFNTTSIVTWNEYICRLNSFEGIAFKMELVEKNWTKEELFKAFPEFRKYANLEQLLGGVFIMKRDFATEFCTSWLHNMRAANYGLLGDSFDKEIQDPGFILHRHDQSFFSLMSKGDDRVAVLDSLKEVYFEPNWEKGYSFPIWTSRNKSLFPKYKKGPVTQFLRLVERFFKRIL